MKVIKNSLVYVGVSAFFLVLSLFAILFGNLNLGIDMTGGTQIDYDYSQQIDIEQLKSDVESEAKDFLYEDENIINNTSVYKVTGEKTLSVVVGFDNTLEPKILEELKEKFREKTSVIIRSQDQSAIEAKYVNIGKSF